MAPQYLNVQEANGTKVALLDSYQNYLPYGYNSTTGAFAASSNCNSTSMINSSTILYANPNGGLPIVDPACNVISSYLRSQPTREIFPTEILRLQSTSIKNLSMNGDIRYTDANMNLPNYYEQFQGLQGANRSIAFGGNANAKREVMAIDYGVVWQAYQDCQPRRTGELHQRSSAGNRRGHHRDHRNGAHDSRPGDHQQHRADDLHNDQGDHNFAGRLQTDHSE